MKKRKVIVSEHAFLRYLERVGGFDIEGLRRQIAAQLRPSVDLGARGVVIGGHSFIIDYTPDDSRAIVTTVLPVTRSPRKLMGRTR